MKKIALVVSAFVLGCTGSVVDETGDSSPGTDDDAAVSSNHVGASGSSSGPANGSSGVGSTTGSGGASASSSSVVTVGATSVASSGSGGGSSVASSSSVGGGASASSSSDAASSSSSGTGGDSQASSTGAGAGGSGGGPSGDVPTVTLAANPVSGVIVKKSQNVDAVGITVTTGSNPTTVMAFTLTGQAQIGDCSFGSQCAREGFAQRVTSLALYDGTTQVGAAMGPDTGSGKAYIGNINVAIPANSSKTFTVKASFGSTASVTEPFDEIAIGLDQLFDATFKDPSDQLIIGKIQEDILDQTWTNPTVVQTIRPSGELTIENYATPVSQIIIAGKDAWFPFVQYKATATYEDMKVDRLAVEMSSPYPFDPSDVAEVAIASNGMILGQDVMNSSGVKDVDLSQNPIIVPKDSSVIFQVWVKTSSVVPTSANPATTGVPRSGHAPAIGLVSGLTTGEWDANYADALNARTSGMQSGERAYLDDTTATPGNPMVLRKSQPIVTKQALPSTTLANIDMDLFKVQIAADAAGPVAVHGMTFNVLKSANVTLSNFGVRRGATEMQHSEFAIFTCSHAPQTTQTDCLSEPGASTNGGVWVYFVNDETISGLGNVYTLHAQVDGIVIGSQVTMVMDRTGQTPITGTWQILPSDGWNWDVCTDWQSINTCKRASFLWSDYSEVPHSSTDGYDGGSADWTDDFLVQDLSQSQTLSF